jgi:hypothetical protein
MTKLDLDALEAAARAARDVTHRERWQQGSMMDEDPTAIYACPANCVPQSVADCFRREVATHIATADPDAVLALVARIRELEAALGEALDGWERRLGMPLVDYDHRAVLRGKVRL